MVGELPNISCLVINYNGMEHLKTCLESLFAQEYENTKYEVVVQDDCSTDDSVAFARKIANEQLREVRVHPNRKNVGFCGTVNRGFKNCDYDWVLLLNNDVEVAPGCLQALAEASKKYPSVRIFGMKMMLFKARQVINGVGNTVGMWAGGSDRGMFEKDEGQYDEPCEVFGACGGAMMVHKDAWNRVGGMDEHYWWLFDDIDFSWRARLLGEKVMAIPQAVVYHKLGGYFGRNSPFKDYLIARNRLLMLVKNHSRARVKEILPLFLKYSSGEAMKKARHWLYLHFFSVLADRWRIHSNKTVPYEEVEKFIVHCPGVPALVVDYEIVDTTDSGDAIVMGVTDHHRLGPGWSQAKRDVVNQQPYRNATHQSIAYFRVDETSSSEERHLLIQVKGGPIRRTTGEITIKCGERVLAKDTYDLKSEEPQLKTIPFSVSQLGEGDVIEVIINSNEMWPINKCRTSWGVSVYWMQIL